MPTPPRPGTSVAIMDAPPAAPVGNGQYIAQPGDCISSVAFKHGHFWETLWNDQRNAAIKESRKDPNVLLPGDRVYIPDKRKKEVSKPPEQTHRFRLKGVPAKFKLCLQIDGQARANQKYKLKIGSKTIEGTTDAEGFLEAPLPPSIRSGELHVIDKHSTQILPLNFGVLDPIDSELGAIQRLAQLGYEINDDAGPAIRKFQTDYELQQTGTINQETRDKLKEVYGQ